MTGRALEPQFIEGPSGRLFVLLRRNTASDRCILVVPPFAEELNRSRPQISATSRKLVESGYSVVLPDLYGTGDSEGEFGEASWDAWSDDLDSVLSWIEGEGLQSSGLIAVRLGCALAAGLLRRHPSAIRRAAFWQPVADGESYLKQFLRLRVAAAMARDERETVDGLIGRLERGETLEVAGYAVSPALAASIRRVALATYTSLSIDALAVFQVNRASPRSASSAAAIADAAENEGAAAAIVELRGGPYWASAEIAVNPILCRRTAEWFAGES